jgi:hypothetical protein
VGGFFAVLPLSIVMIAGPQVITSVFLATSRGWAKNSLVFLLSALVAITTFVTIAYLISKGAKGGSSSSSNGSERTKLDVVLLVLLLFLAVRTYLGRKEAEPPKWMGKLQDATPKLALVLGLLLLGLFPTDIATSAAVGLRLARDGSPWWHSLGFVGLTVLLLAIPSLLVLILGARAQAVLPKVRDWMNNNSWVISECVLGIFIVIEASDLLGS